MLSLTVIEFKTVFFGMMKSFLKIVLVIAMFVAVLVYMANKFGSPDDTSRSGGAAISANPAEVVRMTT